MNPTLHIAVLLCPMMAVADIDAAYGGTWCGQGETQSTMHIDAYGLGFNEHTFCDWKGEPIVGAESFSGMLTCRNSYVGDVDGDDVSDVVHTDIRRGILIEARRRGDWLLDVTLSDFDGVLEYGPCG